MEVISSALRWLAKCRHIPQPEEHACASIVSVSVGSMCTPTAAPVRELLRRLPAGCRGAKAVAALEYQWLDLLPWSDDIPVANGAVPFMAGAAPNTQESRTAGATGATGAAGATLKQGGRSRAGRGKGAYFALGVVGRLAASALLLPPAAAAAATASVDVQAQPGGTCGVGGAAGAGDAAAAATAAAAAAGYSNAQVLGAVLASIALTALSGLCLCWLLLLRPPNRTQATGATTADAVPPADESRCDKCGAEMVRVQDYDSDSHAVYDDWVCDACEQINTRFFCNAAVQGPTHYTWHAARPRYVDWNQSVVESWPIPEVGLTVLVPSLGRVVCDVAVQGPVHYTWNTPDPRFVAWNQGKVEAWTVERSNVRRRARPPP